MPIDLEADSNLRQWAEQKAQQAYYEAIAGGQSADRALNAAKFEWQKQLDSATQTGMWNGQWNNPQEQWYTSQFGTWYGPGGAPNAGDQTLQARQQDFQQGLDTSQLYGQYYGPGTTPTAGQQTLAAQQQANQLGLNQASLTGWYNAPGSAAGSQGQQTLAGQQQQFSQGLQTEQEARAAQGQQQSQTQAYLQLLSSLRGPADWAKYQQVLGSTPGGMRDLVAAAMGQYVPGGGATTGMQPQAASLQSMMGQVGGYDYSGQGGGQLGQPNVYQGGQGSYGQYGQSAQGQPQFQTGQWNPQQQQKGQPQMQTGQWNPQQQQGQPQFQTGQWNPQQQQGQAWGSGIGVGNQQATPDQQQQGLGGGTNMPAPNQVAAESWKNLAPSQQQMMLGMWEGQGWNKDDVTSLMSQALPKYASNSSTAGTWRLQ
jgi:hypothetical protein